MSRKQRLGFLAVAAGIAVVAVIVLTGGGSDDSGSGSKANATTTPTATETPAGTRTPESRQARPRLPVLHAGTVTKLELEQGDTVRFQVRSDEAQEVHVHGYDLMKDTVPGKPITFSFKASITGIFEVEFEESGEQIGELRVDPR